MRTATQEGRHSTHKGKIKSVLKKWEGKVRMVSILELWIDIFKRKRHIAVAVGK
jgi:hypothetical protein